MGWFNKVKDSVKKAADTAVDAGKTASDVYVDAATPVIGKDNAGKIKDTTGKAADAAKKKT